MIKGNETIYQIFVRNYSENGTFNELTNDLQRLKDLGVDILYLMPINEIGVLNRKGIYGSPYASKDYFSISSDLGNLNDLKKLIENTHKNGMKIILDMVFNHTAPDSILFKTHPEFYYFKNGKPGNRVGDWSDIIDLDTTREDTQEYLLSVLKYWINVGFDGFRFDVASMIDFSFFKMARKELGKEVIFFAESIDDGFVNYLASMGYSSTKDKDMYPVFDVLYNYSWYRSLEYYLKENENPIHLQENINRDKNELKPCNFRANCLENHDCDRISSLTKSTKQLYELTRFSYFLNGVAFIYAGQEYGISHKPDLFEKDPVDWSNKNIELYNLHKQLIQEKHNRTVADYSITQIVDNKIKISLEKNNKIIEEKIFDIFVNN